MKRPVVRVLYRVAAGPRIGFGHLMRCRALARALGTRPTFSVRGTASTRSAAEALGCRVRSDTARALTAADVLVVDDPSPAEVRAWVGRAKRAGLATASIHDGGVRRVEADLIVDGGITAVDPRIDDRLMGTAFTILDSRVAGARVRRDRCRKSGRRSRVLIALGGGSYVFSIVRPLVEKIRRLCPDAAIVIAAGFSRSRPCPSVGAAQWIRRSNGLAGDFAACDVAVVAGGLTLYEACAVGAPAVGLAVVPAQQKAIAAFAASGALVDAGSWKEGEAALGRAAEGVASCLMDRSAADRRARRGRQLVDGRGARRVAARIRALVRCRRTQQVSHG